MAADVAPEELDELPATVTGVLIARLDRLEVPVKDVVRTAAVRGFEFELPVLQHMLRHDTCGLAGRSRREAVDG